MTVKTRKQGNSLMITIPASFNVKENEEYKPMIDENGILSFIPVHENVYEANKDYDFRSAMKEMGIGDNGNPIGKEDAWK
ncbi:type II toxin-antitoxin system PemI/MazE family antitoxin [Companilactobacillus mishanensis]|uniref:AbrB family transcriptional regulator n=1 Tax=Companilactobacillus mishanensis TaxID=2486008 RepID=A0ABW9P6C7_9LACO|nr:AbrB family transcriptional regulator [Companilactobacillus mishanensis]MQS44716.1 AbrB family transcriptional regulator [Companilactobacillus mishanensis]